MNLLINEDVYQKITYLVGKGKPDEISGFCISRKEDPLRVVDFRMVKQTNSGAESAMDDEGLSDYAEQMISEGYEPIEYQRIWLHSHPFSTSKPTPSGTDWDTLKKVLGGHWGIMVIVPGSGPWKAVLRTIVQFTPEIQREILEDMDVKEMRETHEDKKAWDAEYDANVMKKVYKPIVSTYNTDYLYPGDGIAMDNKSNVTVHTSDGHRKLDQYEEVYYAEWCEHFHNLKELGITCFQYLDLRNSGLAMKELLKGEILKGKKAAQVIKERRKLVNGNKDRNTK